MAAGQREKDLVYQSLYHRQTRLPPEDCGGIWGYAELLEAVQDPEHEHHEETLEWLGASFDHASACPSRGARLRPAHPSSAHYVDRPPWRQLTPEWPAAARHLPDLPIR